MKRGTISGPALCCCGFLEQPGESTAFSVGMIQGSTLVPSNASPSPWQCRMI